MSKPNAFYAQSGGVTSVINASACGVIESIRENRNTFGKLLAGANGILGALNEELIDTSLETKAAIANLRYTPGGAFGSCRYKLKSFEENEREYRRLIDVFRAHDIRYFFYNGGGDSQDTANKVSELGKKLDFPVQCIGIPKTVDNDLPHTDCSPGFGSVAKYIAISTKEAALDIQSMCATSTKVFVLEVMGRHAGWIAASSVLARKEEADSPHIVLLPEIPFSKKSFLKKVNRTVKEKGFCVVVVSEGVRDSKGKFLSDSAAGKDAFGHPQLGGVAPIIANMVTDNLGFKNHWAVADYLQRSARHIASGVDVEQAYQVGRAAVRFALQGKTAVMPTIIRKNDQPYRWSIGEVKLSKVANIEKKMPRSYIDAEGFNITKRGRNYLAPLIKGEDFPKFQNGMPVYAKLKRHLVAKKLNQKW